MGELEGCVAVIRARRKRTAHSPDALIPSARLSVKESAGSRAQSLAKAA